MAQNRMQRTSPVVTVQNSGPVIDKQAAMQQSVDRNSYQTGLVVRPFSNTELIKTKYRRGVKQLLRRVALNLAGMTVAGTSELSDATKPANLAFTNAAALKAAFEDPRKAHLLFKALTYSTVDVGEHLIFAKGDAYTGVIGTYAEEDEALVVEIAAGRNEKYHPSEIKLARLAIGLKDAAISQSNSHNPAYSMNIAEIYDRMMDYFHAVSLSLVLYYNAIAFFGAEGDFKLGMRAAWSKTNFRDIFEPSTKLNFLDKIADLKRALLGQYYLDFSLVDYLDFGVVSLLPNQDAGFRYLIPKLHDHNVTDGVGYTYTGSQLFEIGDDVATKYAAFKTAVDSIIDYFSSPTAKLLAAMATGFNQFPVLKALPDSYALRVSSRILHDMEDNQVAYFGFNTTHTLGDSNANALLPFTSNSGTVGGVMAVKRSFGGDPKFAVINAAAVGDGTDLSVEYPDVVSFDDPMSTQLVSIVGTGYKQLKERTDVNGKHYGYTNINTAAGLRRIIHDYGFTYDLKAPYSLGMVVGTPVISLDDRPELGSATVAAIMCSAALSAKLGVYAMSQTLYFGGDIDTPFSVDSDSLFCTSSAAGGSANVQMTGEVALAKWYLAHFALAAQGLVIMRIGNFKTAPGTSYLSMSASLGLDSIWTLPYVIDARGYLLYAKSDDLVKIDWQHAKFYADRANGIVD